MLAAPQHECFYHPTGAQDARSRFVVFYRPNVSWGGSNRPVLWVLQGGGWKPQSGNVPDLFDTDPPVPTIQARLYKEGWAIAYCAYTVTDPALPGSGAFDYRAGKIVDGALVIDSADPAKVAMRSSEWDFAHALQYQRDNQIGDLSQSFRKQVALGKSAGHLTACFCAFGPDRADPTAPDGSRFLRTTRLAAYIGFAAISSWRAWKPGKKVVHMSDGNGGAAPTVGLAQSASAPGFSGAQNAAYASPLWQIEQQGPGLALTRYANARMPVWLDATGSQNYFGPLDYQSINGVLQEDHPVEGVLSTRQALFALEAETGGSYVHGSKSRFVINWAGTDEQRVRLQAQLASEATGS